MPDVNPLEIDVLLHQPIPVTITAEDGTREIFNLPRLGVDGLLPWLEELTAERYAFYAAEIERAAIKDVRTLIAARYAARTNTRAVLTDLNMPVQTPAGMRRVLSASIVMADVPFTRRTEVLDKIMMSADVAYTLATRLSTLFSASEERPERPDPKQEIADRGREAFPGAKVKDSDAGPLDGSQSGQPSDAPASTTTG